MKFLLDFGPIILFFIVYKYYGLYAAIYAMIASTFVQIMYSRFSTGKFVTSQVLTFALLVVFGDGSVSLKLEDERVPFGKVPFGFRIVLTIEDVDK